MTAGPRRKCQMKNEGCASLDGDVRAPEKVHARTRILDQDCGRAILCSQTDDLGLSEQGEDGLLLGPAAGRTRKNGRRLCRSVRAALGARKLGLCGGYAVRHLRILFGCDGTRRRHHRSPAVAPSPAGQDPGSGHRPISRHGDSDALFAAEVHSFLR
jgi:hypothetical protein